MAGGRENLIPRPLKDTDNSDVQAARGAKGGAVCSDKKKLAARLREMKKKGMTDDNARVLAGMMESNDLYGLEILKFLSSWLNECRSPGQAAMLGNTLINLQKGIHGEKIKTESTSTNTNINVNIDMMKFNELAQQYSK